MSTHTPDALLTRLSPADLLTVLLWGEARGVPILGQIAVACSVRNRVKAGRFGVDWAGVILRWAAFSCVWETLGGSNFQAVLACAERRVRAVPPDDVERQLAWIAQGVITGTLHADPTGGATHYYDTSIAPPVWAKAPAHESLVAGRLHFWAGVA